MPNLDAVIQDACSVLITFIKTNPEAWAPIISQWSINLLGQISSKYSERRAVPHSASLNELLQLWMTCLATKTLMELASECFAAMISGSADVCVSALLEASVKYSPHFDWVVAHLGSCFPQTIITRVLMCGLKDFCYHGSSQSDMPSSEKVPKMASVVGILGHLAGQHGQNIRKALLGLFEESLRPDADAMQLSTVPFLLQLASMSNMLLQVLTTDIVHTLSTSAMNKLSKQFTEQKSPSMQDTAGLLSLVVHLITRSSEGAYKLLQFLLDSAVWSPEQDSMNCEDPLSAKVRHTCSVVMDQLVIDLQQIIHRKGSNPSTEIPFLAALQGHAVHLADKLMTDTNSKRCSWLSKLLCQVGLYCGITSASDILCHIVVNATDMEKLNIFIEMKCEMETRLPDVTPNTIQKAMERLQPHYDVDVAKMIHNLLCIIKWERQTGLELDSNNTVFSCMKNHVVDLATQLLRHDVSISMATIELLATLRLTKALSSSVSLKLAGLVVHFFFNALFEKDASKKGHCLGYCRKFIKCLCQHPEVRQMMVRFLLEAAVSQEYSAVLGGKFDPLTSVESAKVTRPKPMILEANRKHSVYMALPQSHASVFHAGVIGKGLKKQINTPILTKAQVFANRQFFSEVICDCCFNQGPTPQGLYPQSDSSSSRDTYLTLVQGKPVSEQTEQALKTLALLVVELTTMDVLYNGLHWPEERWMEFTVERNLFTRKKIEAYPVLWDMLDIISYDYSALSQCSCVLRGMAAAMMAFWEGARDKMASNTPKQLELSCRLIEIMGKGGLLPPPLSYIGEIFPLLTPYEVNLLLLSVWRYMKENPPIPMINDEGVMDRPCGPEHTEVIRSILHSNIGKLGHLYARFFTEHKEKT
ncbi:integrator complex subunit 5-like [Lingula anatina]|uniref:Integrator complex subunit 5-like n=1 Tax=Lingula anatina TaxID=7574 RepID=A0A1S3J582_LINAN|nr:integrator complex subunit 5-like [Lingula anatina]|eukprot:XP_013405421.1 integrator complex subunit 5-like [Lingula anatina]